MKRHRNHQIDELAQRVLRDALPPTWVLNEQHNDYGKDYLVEIGEDDGQLTGSGFYLQLKGQEEATFSADGTLVKFSLDSKYAKHYLDDIKDLPVFLVVVDVGQQKGWWVFLQPVLDADEAWRNQDSITIRLPADNQITETAQFRKAVEEAKKWMRLHHPESIHESVIAHKERVKRTDPRFDVAVSLVDDKPNFTLLAKEKVPLTFRFSGDPEELRKKLSDLMDRGALVGFEPGEVKVSGSKLFEQIEQTGCSIQAGINWTGTITLVCRDADDRELARLSDLPGQFYGGRKEIRFEGDLVNSPLTVKLGPIAQDVGGSVKLDINLDRWNGQPLNRLAYFDRLFRFFHALPKSTETEIECQQDGNTIFSVKLPIQTQPFAEPLAYYLEVLWKARQVAQHFKVNPFWSVEAFDEEAQENSEQMYGIFFEGGWTQPMPNVRLKASCIRKTFRFDAVKRANKPGHLRLASDCAYEFLGEKIDVGHLVQDYTEMSINIVKKKQPTKKSKAKKKGKRKKTQRARPTTVDIEMVGAKGTIFRIARDEESMPALPDGSSVLSERSNVRKA